MNAKKIEAIRALDMALDEQIISCANGFTKSPNPRDLELFIKLMDADKYTDGFLEKVGMMAADEPEEPEPMTARMPMPDESCEETTEEQAEEPVTRRRSPY